jgi:CDGSH-type Zn-finger protein
MEVVLLDRIYTSGGGSAVLTPYSGSEEARLADSRIIVRNNGPIRIEGDNIVLTDQDGKVFGLAGRTVISLCRCGQSANKPFCDGTHNKIGFDSQCAARELPPPPPPKTP